MVIGLGARLIVQVNREQCTAESSLVPRPHLHGEEKGSGYNMTSCPTLEGCDQHAIVSDHVLTYGILSM